MSKPIHPIRKIWKSLQGGGGYRTSTEDCRIIARHVKPLLDALEQCSDWMEDQGCDCGTDEPRTCALCVAREHLAAWRAKP